MGSTRQVCVAVAGMVTLLLLASTALADDCFPVLGRWSYGPTDVVETAGSLVYYSSGGVLKIADASNPAQPQLLGEIDTEDAIADLEISGDYAYVVPYGKKAMLIVDVRDPLNPRLKSRFVDDPHLAYALDVEVNGTTAYLFDPYDGIWVIDVHDPVHAEVVGSYVPPPDQYGNIAIMDAFALSSDYVYVVVDSQAYLDATLRVVDLSDPRSPVEIGRLESPWFSGTRSMLLRGSHAYVSRADGLALIDIADPEDPAEVGLVSGHWGATNLAIGDDRLYSADHTGLRIYDVTEPTAPRYVAYGFAGPRGYDVALAGDSAFVALGSSGLQVLDIGQLSVMAELGAADTPGQARDLTVVGDRAYIADGRSGLRILDVAHPESPIEIGSIDTPGVATAVAVVGQVAYVADRDHGVRLIDAGNPSAMTEIATVPGTAVDIDVSGVIALIAGSGEGLRVVDVSDPAAPTEVAGMAFEHGVAGVRRDGDLAFLAIYGTGLKIVDIAVPDAPVLVGEYSSDQIEGVAAESGFAYVSQHNRLEIVDVRDPASPIFKADVSVTNLEPGIEVRGGRAYLPAGRDGLQVYDVSEPTEPVHLGFYRTSAEAGAVRAAGGLAYVVGQELGLTIIDVGSPSLPPVIGGVETPDATELIAAYRNFVYVVRDTGLQVLRVTSSGRPVDVRFVELPFRPGSSARVEGDRLYLTVANSAGGGMAIFSLDNPGRPRLEGRVEQPGLWSFAVENTLVYAQVSGVGVLIFDVSDPTTPVEIGRLDSPNDSFQGLAASRGTAIAFIDRYPSDQVILIDVSDPTAPRVVDRFSLSDEAGIYVVGIQDDVAILGVSGSEEYELRSYDVSDPANPVFVDSTALGWMYPRSLQFAGRRVVVRQHDWFVRVIELLAPGILKDDYSGVFFPDIVESVAITDRYLHVAVGRGGFVTHDLSLTCDAPRPAGGRAGSVQGP